MGAETSFQKDSAVNRWTSALYIFVVVVLPLVAGCSPREISWRDLREKGELYDEKTISICGWLRIGFEVCSLSEKPSNDYSGPGMIWVSPEGNFSCAMSEDVEEERRWVVVTGKYQRSKAYPLAGFGHLGAYGAMISDAQWVPAEKECRDPEHS